LFGRRFRVVSVSHPPQRPGQVTVAYRKGMRLRIAALATNLAPSNVAPPAVSSPEPPCATSSLW